MQSAVARESVAVLRPLDQGAEDVYIHILSHI
jgi:hypothetical protein